MKKIKIEATQEEVDFLLKLLLIVREETNFEPIINESDFWIEKIIKATED